MRNRPKLRGAAAVGIGVVFNLLLFAALAALNRPQPVEARMHAPVRLALFQLPLEEPLRPEPERERELPAPPELDPVPVDMDLRAAELELVDLPQPRITVALPPIRIVPVVRRETRPVRAAPARPRSHRAAERRKGEQHRRGPWGSDEIDAPPRELSVRSPAYPATALRRGEEGAVTVRLLIDEKGRVEKVEVVSVDGYRGFGTAVLNVAGHWRFTPPRHEGRPVKAWALKTTEFRLR